MREIKFRAWDKEFELMIDYGELEANGKKPSVYFSDESYAYMQYTGLKDKGGKEIYEGDIISVQNGDSTPEIGEVVYNKENTAFAVKLETEGEYHTIFHKFNMEVLGNIYAPKTRPE